MGIERRLSRLEERLGTPEACPRCRGNWVAVVDESEEPRGCPECGRGGTLIRLVWDVVYEPADQIVRLHWPDA